MIARLVEPVLLPVIGVVCPFDVGTVELWVDWVGVVVTTPFRQFEALEISINLSSEYWLIYQV